MAATNTPWDLDNAVLSRFEKRIYTPLPDEHAVREMIKLDIQKKSVELDVDMQKIAKICVLKLFAGRDVATLCKEAHWNMWRQQNEKDKISNLPPDNIKNSPPKIRSLSESDFEKALSNVKGTVKKRDVIEHERWAKMYAADEPVKEETPKKGLHKIYAFAIILCILVLIWILWPPFPPDQPEPPTFYNSLGWEFVMIPPGEFDMGSPQDQKFRDKDEGPVHRVKIAKAFNMSKYEITQKQWRDVMGTNVSNFEGDNLPVEQVSWNDAQEFIKKLNENDNTNKYRLPSEAEWEYAAGAGNKTIYYFGDNESDLGDYAWYDMNSGRETHEVGKKKPNKWGLYDMHGNVWEWVQDVYYDSYQDAPTDGSAWEGNASHRVIRGGSFSYSFEYLSLTSRNNRAPDFRQYTTGFRLVKDS
jgi:formylglycine-generating enzyme required for sulfatase activity